MYDLYNNLEQPGSLSRDRVNPNFQFEVKTTVDGETFTLPIYNGGTYDFIVDWGDESESTITTFDSTENPHTYATAGTHNVSISGTITGWKFDGSASASKIYDISSWGSVGFGDFAFRLCGNLTVSAGNSPIFIGTSLNQSFLECSKLQSVPWLNDVVGLTSLRYGLAATNGVVDQDFGSMDVSSVTNAEYFLSGQTLSTTNYNATLIGWEAQDVNDNIVVSFGTSKYSGTLATEARSRLIADHNWTITDGGEDV